MLEGMTERRKISNTKMNDQTNTYRDDARGKKIKDTKMSDQKNN